MAGSRQRRSKVARQKAATQVDRDESPLLKLDGGLEWPLLAGCRRQPLHFNVRIKLVTLRNHKNVDAKMRFSTIGLAMILAACGVADVGTTAATTAKLKADEAKQAQEAKDKLTADIAAAANAEQQRAKAAVQQ